MTTTAPAATTHHRPGSGPALALALAGPAFLLYAAVRPAGDTLADMASTAWVVAHLGAIAGFVLLLFGLAGLRSTLAGGRGERPALLAAVTGTVGVGLTLPYYGAEDFGLHAIGRAALAASGPTASVLAGLPDAVRFDPAPTVTFLVGLLLLALAAVLAAVALHRATVPSWAAVPLAAAFVLFIPQFFAPAPVRVLHGVLLAVGCVTTAVALARRSGRPVSAPPRR